MQIILKRNEKVLLETGRELKEGGRNKNPRAGNTLEIKLNKKNKK